MRRDRVSFFYYCVYFSRQYRREEIKLSNIWSSRVLCLDVDLIQKSKNWRYEYDNSYTLQHILTEGCRETYSQFWGRSEHIISRQLMSSIYYRSAFWSISHIGVAGTVGGTLISHFSILQIVFILGLTVYHLPHLITHLQYYNWTW